jgi:hypothetical protein
LVIISYTSPQQTSIRGRVVERITGPEAEEHIDKLAVKYTGEKFKWRQPGSRRIILKIKPEKNHPRLSWTAFRKIWELPAKLFRRGFMIGGV